MKRSRQHVYEALGAARGAFLERVSEVAHIRPGERASGSIALSGSQSVRPAYLLPEVVQKMVAASRSPTNLITYLEDIRDVVKRNYGDEFDAMPIATCEAGLWASLELFATPPLAGRGDNYRPRT